jgi:hypothetical protein
MLVCVCAFSLRRESPDMILGDKTLISEVVLSQSSPQRQDEDVMRSDGDTVTFGSVNATFRWAEVKIWLSYANAFTHYVSLAHVALHKKGIYYLSFWLVNMFFAILWYKVQCRSSIFFCGNKEVVLLFPFLARSRHGLIHHYRQSWHLLVSGNWYFYYV